MVVSESSGTGRTLLRFLAIDASGETERCLFPEIIPGWIYDVVVKVSHFSIKTIHFLLKYFSLCSEIYSRLIILFTKHIHYHANHQKSYYTDIFACKLPRTFSPRWSSKSLRSFEMHTNCHVYHTMHQPKQITSIRLFFQYSLFVNNGNDLCLTFFSHCFPSMCKVVCILKFGN